MMDQRLADRVTRYGSARPGILAKLPLVGKPRQNAFLQTKLFPVELSVTVIADMYEKKSKMNTITAGT